VLRQGAGAIGIGDDVLESGDVSQLEAVIDVLSEDATDLESTMTVRLKSGVAGPAWIGQVRSVEPVAHTKVSTLGIEEQRVNVIVDFPPAHPTDTLGDGYRVQATIVVNSQRDALLIPIGAASRDAQGWHVFIVKEGRAVRRGIDVHARSTESVWIEDGLEVGEQVIVYPSDEVRDGVRVRPETARSVY